MPRKKKNPVERVSIKITEWVGTPLSIILHTTAFIGAFFLMFLGISAEKIMLGLTTLVSLEAIYLSLFIQMSVNRQAKSIAEVEKDIDEIEEDVGQIQVAEAEDDADFDKTHASLATIENHILQVTQNLTNLRTELDALKSPIHKSSNET